MDGTVIADPSKVGCLRTDPRSTDESYRVLMARRLYTGINTDVAAADLDLLTPDPVHVTAGAWGRIPRDHSATSHDEAIAPAVQQIMMDDADALTPDNLFRRIPIDPNRGAFASPLGKIAEHIAHAARR